MRTKSLIRDQQELSIEVMVTGNCFLRAITNVAHFSCWGHAVGRVGPLDLSPVNRHSGNEMELLTAVIAVLGIVTVSPAFAEYAYEVNDAQSNPAAYGGASDGSYSSGTGVRRALKFIGN